MSRLKKALATGLLGVFTLTGVSAGVSGCGPSGELVKTWADGMITEEQELQILERIRQGIPVTSLDSQIQELVNDQVILSQKVFDSKGIDRSLYFTDFSVYVADDEKEVDDIFRDMFWRKPKGYMFAFYSGLNNTTYIPQTDFLTFFDIFNHEWGHSFRPNDGEVFAQTNELYNELTLRNKAPLLGALMSTMLDVPYFDGSILDYIDEKGKDLAEYEVGTLAGIYQFIKYDGDLEKGLDAVFSMSRSDLENEMYEYIISKTHGLKSTYLTMMEDLINAPKFRSSFPNLSDDEFDEMHDYYNILFMRLGGRTEDYGYQSSLEDYVNNDKYQNPYYRNMVTSWLSSKYIGRIGDFYTNESYSQQYKDQEVFKLATKVIEVNNAVPCEYHPTYCPIDIAVDDHETIEAYYYAVFSAWKLKSFDPKYARLAIDYATEFFNRFYDDDYKYDEKYPDRSDYGPDIAILAAYLHTDLAYEARDDGDLGSEAYHLCEAIYWRDIVNESACMPDDVYQEKYENELSSDDSSDNESPKQCQYDISVNDSMIAQHKSDLNSIGGQCNY